MTKESESSGNPYDDLHESMRQVFSDDDEPTCPSCGGPMYTQAHWHYWQCDDCGRWDDKEEMEP